MMKNRITTVALHTLAALTFVVVFAVARGDAETYTYDDLGRLTRIAYADGTSLDYTYDANGNRLSLVANGSSGGDTGGGDTPAAGGGGGGGGCYIETIAGGAFTDVHREYPPRSADTPPLLAAAFSCMAAVLPAVWFVLRKRKSGSVPDRVGNRM